MLKKLTKSQEKEMNKTRGEFLNRFFSGEKIDQEKAREGINFIYSLCKLNPPEIIFVSSPLGAQLYANILKFYGKPLAQVTAQVGDQVGDQVRAQVGDQVRDQVRDHQVTAQVVAQVTAQVMDQVTAQMGEQVMDQVTAQVMDQVTAQVGEKISESYRSFEYTKNSYYGNYSDYGWVSFFSFFEKIGIFKNENFIKFKKIIEANVYDTIQLRGVCIACELPKKVKRDEKNRLHSLDGNAIEWRDSYGQNYIHGVYFSPEEFENFTSGKTTALEIINEKNQDKKRAMALAYGNENLIKELKAKEESREIDNQGNEMRILSIKDGDEYMIFYEAFCPSKMEKVYLRIPPEFKNKKPIEAKIWTFPFLWEEYERTGIIPEFAFET